VEMLNSVSHHARGDGEVLQKGVNLTNWLVEPIYPILFSFLLKKV